MKKMLAAVVALTLSLGNAQITVTPGSSGWIFLDEEYLFGNTEVLGDLKDSITLISQVDTLLKNRGVKLVISPVPIKARLYKEYLTKPLPTVVDNRYATILRELQSKKITVADTNSLLVKSKASSNLLYNRMGSHWSPEGAFIAAKATAQTVIQLDEYKSLAKKEYIFKKGQIVKNVDNLSNVLSADMRKNYPSDNYQIYDFTEKNSVGLLDEEVPEVALVGTSYSEAAWSFPGALRYHLKTDILDASQPGRNIWPPMSDYLNSDAFQDAPPKILIWEIPERYFLTPPGGPRNGGLSWINSIFPAVSGSCKQTYTAFSAKFIGALKPLNSSYSAKLTQASDYVEFALEKQTGIQDYISLVVSAKSGGSLKILLDEGSGFEALQPLTAKFKTDSAPHRLNIPLITQTGRGYKGIRVYPGTATDISISDLRVCASPKF